VVNSTQGYIGCLEGEQRLSRYTILKTGEVQTHTLMRSGVWFDMLYIRKHKIVLALEKESSCLYRIDGKSVIDKIGKGYAGDRPGRCFRIDPAEKRLYILTKTYKISGF
jgi:hypothetical protein